MSRVLSPGVLELDDRWLLFLTHTPLKPRPLGLRAGAKLLLHSAHPILAATSTGEEAKGASLESSSGATDNR